MVLMSVGVLSQTSDVRAQDENQYAITVNVLSALNGVGNVEIERAIADPLSVHAGVDFIFFDGVFHDRGNELFGVGPVLGLRLYLLGDAPSGLYVDPFVGAAYLSAEGEDDIGFEAGAMAGFNFTVLDALALGVGVGGAYHDYTLTVGGERYGGLDGFEPRFRLAAGIAF